MIKLMKKGLSVLLISALFITSIYAGIAISDTTKDVKAENSTSELLKEYSKFYGNITYGTNLYVWSGDNEFKAEKYLPDCFLDDNETIEYSEGQIDLTPGAISPVIYKITSKDGKERYEMYTFTAVSRKSSSTVQSAKQNKIIYGLSKSDGFSGYVPYDYTKSGITYNAENEINIVKGQKYYK